MTQEEFYKLRPGDVVAHRGSSGASYVVTMHYGSRVTAVKTADITNPDEWRLVFSPYSLDKKKDE